MCAALSLFWKVTDSPGLIVIVAGRKHSFVSSQPGVDEPCAFSTVFDVDDVVDGSAVVSGSVAGSDSGVEVPPSPTITNPAIHG